MHKIELSPVSWACFILAATCSFFSPKRQRLSEWPIKVQLISKSLTCSALISPVKAPFLVDEMFCAQTRILESSMALAEAICREIGATTTSTRLVSNSNLLRVSVQS